jgi:hypothetical protein
MIRWRPGQEAGGRLAGKMLSAVVDKNTNNGGKRHQRVLSRAAYKLILNVVNGKNGALIPNRTGAWLGY